MTDEPVPSRPMLHKLQLCLKQSNRQYSADDWVSRACVSLGYTPSLSAALPLAPVRFLQVNVLLLFNPVAVLFVPCLAICGLCSVLPSAPLKVLVLSLRFPRSLLHAFVVSNLCFACFASQTSGLCSAIPLAPTKFVERLCLILLYSVIFLLRALPHKLRFCAVLFLRLP